MRYALRNKLKIKKYYSQQVLDRIIKSLDVHFEENETIELQESGEQFPIIIINDEVVASSSISFYVIGIKYDVFRLAFKEFIG